MILTAWTTWHFGKPLLGLVLLALVAVWVLYWKHFDAQPADNEK